MQMIAFDDRYGHHDYEFYEQYFKRSLWLSFKFFLVWSMWPYLGRVHLKKLFSLEFGVVLDSNVISRILKDLGLNLSPKRRIRSITFDFDRKIKAETTTELLLMPIAEKNLREFNNLDQQDKTALLTAVTKVAAGETLSEIQNQNPKSKPFSRLKKFGSQLKSWHVHNTDKSDAIGIAIDEKVVTKAFNLGLRKNLSSHWVSRSKKYLPSLIVEVVGLIRPGRMAEVVGHYFPYPQREYDHKNRRKSMKKHLYLKSFLEAIFEKYGRLPLLADANYCTMGLVSWLMETYWDFVMRINPIQKKLLQQFQEAFDNDLDLVSQDQWVLSERFGGHIRILAFRRFWTDAKGQKKQKRYFLMTTLQGDARTVWRFYRHRWTLENTFKALKLLDKTPGLDPDRIRAFFALTFHVIAPICYQSRSSSPSLAKLLALPVKIEKKKVVWHNITSKMSRRLLLIAYQRSMDLTEIHIQF